MEGSKDCFLVRLSVRLQKAPNSTRGNLSQKFWNRLTKEEQLLLLKRKSIPPMAHQTNDRLPKAVLAVQMAPLGRLQAVATTSLRVLI